MYTPLYAIITLSIIIPISKQVGKSYYENKSRNMDSKNGWRTLVKFVFSLVSNSWVLEESNFLKKVLTTISDPLDVSLTADGDLSRETAAVAVVVPGWSGLAVLIPPRATTSSTSPLACCRMLMACWWEMLLSRGWPSIARIWSPSWRRPSLKHKKAVRCTHIFVNVEQIKHYALLQRRIKSWNELCRVDTNYLSDFVIE